MVGMNLLTVNPDTGIESFWGYAESMLNCFKELIKSTFLYHLNVNSGLTTGGTAYASLC